MIKNTVLSPAIKVPRPVVPSDPDGLPHIVMFVDGSAEAYAAVIYLRTKNKVSLNWKVQLLASKARVTPLEGITTPRSELNSLVLGVRLLSSVLAAMPVKPAKVTMIGDSQCTISALESQTGTLQAYMAYRVGEIHDTFDTWKGEIPRHGGRTSLLHKRTG